MRVDAFADRLRAIYAPFPTALKPSEATTEQDLIFPILEALGWEFLTQVAAGAGKERDKPDALLFASPDAKARASAKRREPERYPFAAVVAEHKAWRIDLDRAGSGDGSAPASQMLRYLRSAEDLSEGAIRWGMLTNGRVWRLYSTRARSKAEGFLEIDLAAALGIFDAAPEATVEAREHALRLFLLFFGRDAFLPTGRDGRSFLDDALALGRRYEAQVTADLSRAVFEKVFPDLVRALARADPDAAPNNPAWRDAVKDSALILLYRL
ncbi:MAG: restriction endonuclease, partial [Acetobacteraceae bacterium]|nr:restriction endonuclease [Acetobacteraceae bacterium]